MSYGYLHRGRVIEFDVVTGGYIVEIPTLAPTRRMGPFPSLAPNLPVDQRVILASLGTSRDEMVILGRAPGVAPTIGQIPGLQAALDAKADDTEITTINGQLTTLDGRLDVVEPIVSNHTAELATLDGRLDVVEPIVSGHTSTLGTHGTRLTTLEGKVGYVVPINGAVNRPTTGLYDGYPIFRTDKGFLEFYDLANAKWRVRGTVTVGALADVTDPLTGQLVILSTDLMLYRWTGAAWQAVQHTAVDGGHARYKRTSGQSNAYVANQWTRQAFDIAVDTDADVSPNGAFDQWTLNRGGVWEIDSSSRTGATSEDLVRYHLGIFPGATPGSGTYKVMTFIEQFASTNASNLGVTLRRRFSAGDVICVASWKSGGTDSSSDATDEGFCQIDLRWTGP